jgi:hypothetical protein
MGDIESEVFFMADIELDHYTLSMSDGETTVDLPKANYTVNDETNSITIDEPTFPGDEPSGETVSFDVTWVEGGNTMTWTPIEGNDAPILVWTLQTGP